MISNSNKRFAVQSAVLLALGLAWIWISRAPAGAVTGGRIPAPHRGFLAPEISLPDAAGQPLRLSDLRGRPVILNLWASWCAPCRAEMPALERVHREFTPSGLIVLGVNAANQDDRAAALDFIREQALTFPILFDSSGEASDRYAVRALPTTFFINSEGIIRDVVVGGPMAESLLRVRARQLLDGMNTGEAGTR